MYEKLVLIEANELGLWSDAQLSASLPAIERARGRLDADQALVLAELVRRGRAPETMFGSLMSPHEAQRRTKAAVAMSDGSLPGAAAALASGTIALAHIVAMTEILDRLPAGAIDQLLLRATELSPDKFRRALQRAATPVAETAEGTTGVTSSGGRWFRFRFDGHEGTIALNGVEAVMDRQWRAAHPDRADEKLDRPHYGQRLAAAFLEMSRNALAGQSSTTGDSVDEDPAAPVAKAPQRAEPEIMIVVSHEKLFDDAEAAGICTTIDGVPLPVATVRRLLVDAKIYPVVMGGDGEILDFGRGRRFFTGAQKKAAAVRDLSCAFADCDRPIRYADYHHCTPWASGGHTDIGNAAPACGGCHDKLTNEGYRLERRGGITYTYGPDGRLIHRRNSRWQR